MYKCTRYVILLLLFSSSSLCANILGLFPAKFKSHYIVIDSVMTELAKRGHNVTVVNAFPKSRPMGNFTDIDVSACDQLPDDVFSMDEAYKEFNTIHGLGILFELAAFFEPLIACESVQQLLRSDQSFDLIITEIFHTDVMLALTDKFKAPHMAFVMNPLFPWAAERIGNPWNPSYISLPFTDYPMDQKNPTFSQRFWNTVYSFYGAYKHYETNLQNEKMARKYFNNKIPLSEIAKNTSLILSFSHFSFNGPVPLLPNVIEIGGVQIRPAKPLPEDIQKFIDESEHGVIYFSMGSLLRMDTFPDHKRIAFFNAFAKVPQRVIWKWGKSHFPHESNKILVKSWLPQRDILAHPKVKLFIGHGGALGLNEAIYEKVPVLGIPMYSDQTTNLHALQSQGVAEILHYTDIDNDTVLAKIKQVLQPEYSINMKKVSEIFKDRPMSAMDTAIYWIEYVIRHKGAPHLRSAVADLHYYQYLLLDVIAFLLLVIFGGIFLAYYVMKKFLSFFNPIPSSDSRKKNVKKYQ
ncbi:UDP-glycosyltransferase UGT5-like [Planococcus citri]|uniref:UDP-glycosyltransferase UGT5-like n=1 Tax=Planococcus citri TaxID=170843 RepID=UPI0031F85C47